MSFIARLEARARQTGSLLCVGLDPHPDDLPHADALAARDFCLRLIDATADLACAYKPNAAFFEALGPAGISALQEVVRAVPNAIPVVLDVKRADIASTAKAYAHAAFEVIGADAVTLNPWMGRDAITPFVDDPAHGAFVLCRTSNPGGADLQDRLVLDADGGTRRGWALVADLVQGWSTHGNIGLVVGATRPEELAAVRCRAPEVWILAPGVGAQGASLEETVAAGVRQDGLGLLVSVSRGLSRAPDPRAAARELVERMRRAPRRSTTEVRSDLATSVARGLLDAGCVRFGRFTLKSGLQSPIYLDLRRLVGVPTLLADVARLLAARAREIPHDLLAPLPYAAMPIGTALSLHTGTPMVYPRREVKAYGTGAVVEGVFAPGQRALVLDDLATTGGSKLEGIEKLTSVGLVARDVLVLIDRESGAGAAMAEAGVTLHAVFTLTELLELWKAIGAVTRGQAAEVQAFLLRSRDEA